MPKLTTEQIVPIPLGLLDPAPDNRPHRSGFDEKSLTELADSIREKGVVEPLIVRVHPTNPERFQIVCGERRWTAAGRVKLAQVPCLVRAYTDHEACLFL